MQFIWHPTASGYVTRPFYGGSHARIKTHAQQLQKFLISSAFPKGSASVPDNNLSQASNEKPEGGPQKSRCHSTHIKPPGTNARWSTRSNSGTGVLTRLQRCRSWPMRHRDTPPVDRDLDDTFNILGVWKNA